MATKYDKFTPFYNPISLKEPNEVDKLIDSTLFKYMDVEMKIASDDEMRRRDAILVEVKNVFLKFVQTVAIKELNMTEDEAEEAGGDIFISGSHRLGIRDIGADIDAVCIAPNFCTREHFFSILKKQLLNHSDVTDLIAVESAMVPIISFDFRKVSIDLLFASLTSSVVPRNLDILDDKILIGLNVQSEKSLNGPRVTNMIPRLLGNASLPNFRIVLRCVRKWAKNRGIYGNKLGYLGGINCNILVALVLQLYPKASASTLLQRFFYIFHNWKWPKPVKLNHIQQNMNNEDREVWNERDYNKHVMPIITPAYPAMNSTANVSIHSLEVMKQEFARGLEVITTIISERGTNWGKLFEISDFFLKYNHYLCCHIVAKGLDELSRGWIGFVESRIRHLTSNKYLGSLTSIKLPIHIHPIVSKTSKSANSICYFIGFNIDINQVNRSNKVLYLDDCLTRFTDSLYDPEKGFKSDNKDGLEFYVEHYTWKRLPIEVFEPWGGRDFAKAKRNELGYGKKKNENENEKSLKNDNEINNETKNNENESVIESKEKINENIKNENENEILNKKRKLSDDLTNFENKLVDSNNIIKSDMNIPKYLPFNKKQNKNMYCIPNVTWIMIDK